MKETLPYFEYKGRRSLDYGLVITSKNVHAGAQRDVTVTSVPGRDGDLIIDNGRYKNIKITYELAMLSPLTVWTFPELAKQIRDWLLPAPGYYELWDTYDPRYYRMAAFLSQVNIEQELRDYGTLTLQVECMPYRYSIDGRRPIVLTEAAVIHNDEAYPSKPYIKVTGSGRITLTINDMSVTLSNVDEYVELDSEMMNAFKGSTNCNGLMSSEFPTLAPGANEISWSGTVEQVEIIPRWCCL